MRVQRNKKERQKEKRAPSVLNNHTPSPTHKTKQKKNKKTTAYAVASTSYPTIHTPLTCRPPPVIPTDTTVDPPSFSYSHPLLAVPREDPQTVPPKTSVPVVPRACSSPVPRACSSIDPVVPSERFTCSSFVKFTEELPTPCVTPCVDPGSRADSPQKTCHCFYRRDPPRP